MTRGDVETWRCGHCEKGAAGGGGIAKKVGEDRARLRWNLISLMGETFPPGEVISLELSHRVSDFWLIARRRCERHRHPWIQTRQEGCLFFFFFFFHESWTVERRRRREGREREREGRFVSVFFNHPEKEPRTCLASYVWIEEFDGRGEREPVHGYL